MNDTIKAIFNSISTPCVKDCDYVTAAYGKECRKCLVTAELVYGAHFKPLEDALTKAEADKTALVEALESLFDECSFLDECSQLGLADIISENTLSKMRAALARVKGEA